MFDNITLYQWLTICISAVFIGCSKTGIQGITIVTVPYMAMAFGAKESTGIILPMLCIADIMGVAYYHKVADWRAVVRLLPTAVLGFFLAIFVDKQIPVSQFKLLLGLTLLLVFLIMLWNEFQGKENKWSKQWWYAVVFGLLGGFVTMIGNAAGPVMAVYLLSMRKEKLEFVGTNAWFFMIINLLKLPLQIFFWNNITWNSFCLDVAMTPFLALGAFMGLTITKYLPEKVFHRYVQCVTAFSVLMMLIQ